MTAKPIRDQVKGLRQRKRASGEWRVWWEPTAAEKQLGFVTVELDAGRPTWSIRAAEQLNADVARSRKGERPAKRTSGGRTIAALINDYRQSRFFRDQKTSTQRSYSINMVAIEKKWGPAMVAEFSKPVVNTWYETLLASSGTYQAKALTGMLSILFTHAETIGWRPENSNPCFRLKRKTGDKRKRHASWAEYDALIAAADALGMPAMACAIALSTLNSARQTDLLEARIVYPDGKQAFRDMRLPGGSGNETVFAWEYVQSKRGDYIAKPVHPEAAPRVRALIEDAPEGQTYLLHDHVTCRPFSGDLFRKRWAAIRARAAKTCPSLTATQSTLQFRDLRRTFGIWARAGGASKGDVADVLGNSAGQDPGLGEVYMPASFETAMRAVSAVQRPEKEERKEA